MTALVTVPPLEPHCGSWIIVRAGTLEAVAECFDSKQFDRLPADRWQALTAADYLGRLNASIREAAL